MEDIVNTVLKQDGYIKENLVHQAILDIAYSKWQQQNKTGNKWSYTDMIDYMSNEYGEIFAFAVLIGKYHQQVCNGGHQQYYDNHCCDEREFEFDNHIRMLDYFKNCKLIYDPIGKKIFENARAFLDDANFDMEREYMEIGSCDECGGCGTVYVDENDEEEIDCEYCNGTGEIEEEVMNENYGSFKNDIDSYDNEYYKYNEEWIEILEKFFRNELNL